MGREDNLLRPIVKEKWYAYQFLRLNNKTKQTQINLNTASNVTT